MTILIAFINLLLVILALIGFLLTAFGTPVGIILLIIYLTGKKNKKDLKRRNLIVFLLSGLPILFITFTVYALLNLIYVFFGIDAISGQLMNLQ